MIRELVNRIVFEVVGESNLRRINDALTDSGQSAEEAARETQEYEEALRSMQSRLRRAAQGVANFGRRLGGIARGVDKVGVAIRLA